MEKKFLELARSGETFTRKEVSKSEAMSHYDKMGNEYKLELIDGLEDGSITFYESGNFVDLCKGPHIPTSKVIKAVKIMNTAGAYWRGNENNPQMTRIYGISFPKKKELEEYLELLEEAKKRDHRKVGKELELFYLFGKGGHGPSFVAAQRDSTPGDPGRLPQKDPGDPWLPAGGDAPYWEKGALCYFWPL